MHDIVYLQYLLGQLMVMAEKGTTTLQQSNGLNSTPPYMHPFLRSIVCLQASIVYLLQLPSYSPQSCSGNPTRNTNACVSTSAPLASAYRKPPNPMWPSCVMKSLSLTARM